jgi:ribosomal protein S18 acetylase RimI-like enzyme
METLTDTEVADIQQLAEVCNRYENLHLRFSRLQLRNRYENAMPDFLYYDAGQLVGYLSPDNFGVEEKELLGMVHPGHRCRGIFTALVAEAKNVCKARGVQTLIFIIEKNSHSGHAFIATTGAHYNYAEHEMVLASFHEAQTFDDRLNVRPAYDGDVDALASILAESFNDPEEKTRSRVARVMHAANNRFYIAIFGEASLGCKEPVGCLRVREQEDSMHIYGFGVRAEYRRRGYGRQLLEQVIREIKAASNKPIVLDVNVENSPAKALYRSIGFIERTTFEYYNLDII